MHILYTIALIIVIFWLLGVVFHIGAGLIHLLLLVALVLVILRLLTGRRVV